MSWAVTISGGGVVVAGSGAGAVGRVGVGWKRHAPVSLPWGSCPSQMKSPSMGALWG
ncbi:hypothetical protein GCM10011612_18960 [Actinomyces gaoshouyii]|uniref:Uncharacterized protein n=1 Tax=Actinomyces gaoshouyii TaxID=1960083 RepID=A0A8H9HCH5_9ACTO|nr:hypothetical protein GCM10011612_18960 [Actinomyces gaoshouyii]